MLALNLDTVKFKVYNLYSVKFNLRYTGLIPYCFVLNQYGIHRTPNKKRGVYG